MFDSLKGLSQLGPMMAQAREMQQRMKEMQAWLPSLRASASAGGDLVTATASGELQIVSLTFSANAPATDPELLADLTRAAVNQALKKAQELVQEEMSKITGGMDLGGLQNMLGS